MTQLTVLYSNWNPPMVVTIGMCDKCKGIFAMSGFSQSSVKGMKLVCKKCYITKVRKT